MRRDGTRLTASDVADLSEGVAAIGIESNGWVRFEVDVRSVTNKLSQFPLRYVVLWDLQRGRDVWSVERVERHSLLLASCDEDSKQCWEVPSVAEVFNIIRRLGLKSVIRPRASKDR